jgi:catechol 2,3-dioxygenase-like lactoylglutathione lyase family enzyme
MSLLTCWATRQRTPHLHDHSHWQRRISNMSTLGPSEIRPALSGVLETALVVEDVARAVLFYRKVFGFDVLVQTERLCSLNVKPAQVLLLFQRGGSLDDVQSPGGVLPGGMDAQGRSHMAFAVEAEHLESWQHWLRQNGVAIESTVRWERGGTSLYFRDPDGNLLELATPGVWANY